MKFKWGSIMDKKQAIIAAAALAGTTVIGVQTAQADTDDQPVQLNLSGSLRLKYGGPVRLNRN